VTVHRLPAHRITAVRRIVHAAAVDERPHAENVATVIQRLAVILEAGVAPGSAWRYLDDDSAAVSSDSVAPVVQAIRRLRPGGSVVPVLLEAAPRTGPAAPLWRAVAAAWQVSEITGAPLAPCLTSIGASLLDVGSTERAVQIALAGPTATSRLVLGLPLVGLIFGALLGFDTLPFLFSTPAGALCGVAAVLLVLIAHRWSSRMVRAVAPQGRAPGLLLDLTIIALASGRSGPSAVDAVSIAVADCDLESATEAVEHTDREAVLVLSKRAGIPASLLLASEAQAYRRTARTTAARNAEKLGTQLILPLGLCILPAFILIGIVPIVAGILASSIGAL
jgi:tight adherence protein B